ncbi:MAG: NRDE family protein [Gammaproteobacteria bacterium]|uniref:NRDE family protein n=1 Tax=Rhodoferax sp. TaxID=50421 RepID=UPI0017D5F03E|nr:NRDE family protein [Rhodoferax sp.]MBU3897755.1 NRDE family protein [Gammaproteobacteria bacterium]MBA3057985.1 NRDE family protein [Rhodoferax sp.]MBU3997786.1 NRDE family protein [Gammaproteobacteria bacterium]MBU4017830.1 NRDE family protein [Gammaproteobacteria bacterium]MBU4078715.1 NRDE family protein [Gammaproteobacteria bacterium]
MCLIAWNWQPASHTPLLLIANRDEFYARPTAALHWWNEAAILAGRDLQAGGTWLGVSRSGRLAALTNYRDPTAMRAEAPSRGELVSAYLQADTSAMDYLTELAGRAGDYNPFNLLVFDGTSLLGLESRHARIVALQPGLGAVSNADFLTPWPKLAQLKDGLQSLLVQEDPTDEQLLALLHNPCVALDADLPATGLPLAFERALSAAFIATPDYGTRACSIVRFETDHITFLEQSFDAHGAKGCQQLTTAWRRVADDALNAVYRIGK